MHSNSLLCFLPIFSFQLQIEEFERNHSMTLFQSNAYKNIFGYIDSIQLEFELHTRKIPENIIHFGHDNCEQFKKTYLRPMNLFSIKCENEMLTLLP